MSILSLITLSLTIERPIGLGLLGARVANNPLSTSSKKGRHNREYPSDL